ncbi:MAG: putative DNA binding domain-containing protein [Planctomycetales bacterium]|nr:putative DNA binding domain-containing protein [Planctomycetales bacterium]
MVLEHMGLEGQVRDQKSLATITAGDSGFRELAKDCVCFANSQGGAIAIGIEDGCTEPPACQAVSTDLLDRVRKRIGELTVNVFATVESREAKNGGQFILVTISRSLQPASTTDGRYFVRIADDCKPLVGADIQRLLAERNAQPWELLTNLHINAAKADRQKRQSFCQRIRESERVHVSAKDKSDEELLRHYRLEHDGLLTNLGVLLIGTAAQRAELGSAPIIHVIKYDADGNKIKKWVWDDHTLTPLELVEAVSADVSDFHESYELPDGLFRQSIPAFDARVVREILVNALVHRPYTNRGDIYLNLYPDHLTIVNPGLLPLGVTPKNILHQSVRRNTELARVFHDLKLMEREGSGFDLLYDVLTSQAKPLPTVREGNAVLREPESTEDTGVPSPHGSAANRTTSPTRTGQSGLDSPR